MKIILVLLFGISTCLADGLSNDGKSVGTNAVESVWAVPTNSWPSTLWTYKIVPQNFSPAVISNLMALGPFTENNRTNPPEKAPFKDKKMAFYCNKKETLKLAIVPAVGLLFYENTEDDPKKNAINIPTEAQAIQLAMKYLRLCEIDKSQLAVMENGELINYGYYQTGGGKEIVTNAYMVRFARRIDGANFDGLDIGGAEFWFGNNAKLIKLQINWKGFEPYKLYKTLDANELFAKFRKGQGKWTFDPLVIAEKYTITKVNIYYPGAEIEDYKGVMKPFCEFSVKVNTTNGGLWKSEILGQPLRPGEGVK